MFFKILVEKYEKFVFTKHLISMLDIPLQIISPCVMQHVWIGTWPSEFIWMFILCIVLSVRMSSSWRFDVPFIVHGTGQENTVWRSHKILLIKLALSLLQRKPTWGLPSHAERSRTGHLAMTLAPSCLQHPSHFSVTAPSLFPLSRTPLLFYHISSV